MATINDVKLGGNLTADPERREMPNGTPVADFGLAVTRPGSARKGRENGTDYFRVSAFGPLAETILNNKAKGDAVVVDGRIDYSSWEAPDGSKRSRTQVVAESVQFVDTVGNGINAVVLLGNMTRDPETRFVETASESGVPVCSFGLAMNRVRSQKEGAVDFADVDVWRESAEAVQANKKGGDGVLVHGRLRSESWEAEGGSRRYKTKVVADSVQFTSKPRSGAAPKTSANGSAGAKPAYNRRPASGSASGSANGSANGPTGGSGKKATRAQISRLGREAIARSGEDGVAKFERHIGKKLSDLTVEEASNHISSFEMATA